MTQEFEPKIWSWFQWQILSLIGWLIINVNWSIVLEFTSFACCDHYVWPISGSSLVGVPMLKRLKNLFYCRCRIGWLQWILGMILWWQQPISQPPWQWVAIGRLSNSSSNPFIQYPATCGNNQDISNLKFLYCYLVAYR